MIYIIDRFGGFYAIINNFWVPLLTPYKTCQLNTLLLISMGGANNLVLYIEGYQTMETFQLL